MSHLPLPSQHCKQIFAPPRPLEPDVFHIVGLLPKADTLHEFDRRAILSIGQSEYAMLPQASEHVFEYNGQGLRGQSAPMVSWRQGDAQLHLSEIVTQEMDAAVADHRPGLDGDNCQLQPGAWRVRHNRRLPGD